MNSETSFYPAYFCEDWTHQSSSVPNRIPVQSGESQAFAPYVFEQDKVHESYDEMGEDYFVRPGLQEETDVLASNQHEYEKTTRKILSAVDHAGFSTFHIKTVIFCGVGFMADAYDFFCINMVSKLIGRLYFTAANCTRSNSMWICTIAAPGTLSIRTNAIVSTVSLGGALVGQILGGRAGDLYGRKRTYIISLIIMFITAPCSAISFGHSADAVVGSLCFWRFLLGFGVGANYPTTAVAMAEYSSIFRRGTLMAAVFAMQAIGYLVACTVVIVVVTIFTSYNPVTSCSSIIGGHCYPLKAVSSDRDSALAAVWELHSQVLRPSDDTLWRVILALGAVPAAAALWSTYRMQETARFTALVQRRALDAAADMDALMHRSDLRSHAVRMLRPAAGPAANGGGARTRARARPPLDAGGGGPPEATLATAQDMAGDDPAHLGDRAAADDNDAAAPAGANGAEARTDGEDGWRQQVGGLMTWKELMASRSPNFLVQMLGCAGTWFFLDVAFYSQGLFQNDVFTSIGWIPSNKDMTGVGEVYNIAKAQGLIALASTVPGVLVTVYTAELLGRRGIQLVGFFFMTTLMALLSGYYTQLLSGALPSFLGMYCLAFFFANFGPNTTTYMIPAELFPAHWRCTCHGICAAAGKAGAILGATGFLFASQSTAASPPGIGLQPALGVLAATNFVGLVITVFCTPETAGKSLEDLSSPERPEPPPPPGPMVFWAPPPPGRAGRRRSVAGFA